MYLSAVFPSSGPVAGFLRRPALRLAAALSALLLIAGCALIHKSDPTANWSAEQLYTAAQTSLSDENWSAARSYLTPVVARFPFSTYAQQAELDLAYVNWKDGEQAEAQAGIDHFLRLYPDHPGTDYALYLKGLINLSPTGVAPAKLSGQESTERDPTDLRTSYRAFAELVGRFPGSRYAKEAKQHMDWLANALAMNEVYVARYYYEHGSYLAAANRAQNVITDFSGVPATEPALYIMTQAYGKLGMPELQKDAEHVLDKSYPDSKYKKSGLASLSKKAWWQVF